MDKSDRLDAAQAMFDAPEPESQPTAPAEAETRPDEKPPEAAHQGAKPAAAKPAEPASKPEGPPAQEAPAAAPDTYGGRTPEQVRAAIEDAEALYAFLDGRETVATLAKFLEEAYPAVHKALAEHFGGKPAEAKAADGKPAEPAKPDSVAQELAELRGRLDRQERDASRMAKEQQYKKTAKDFVAKVGELAKAAELDAADVSEYCDAISGRIGRDAAALERLLQGNWVDVERLFNEYHGAQLDRAKRWADKQVAALRARDRALPKTPAAGAPPAPESRRPNLADKEQRVALAAEQFRA